ncbi:MAG: KH domain-containing protein [Gracilibacteraceae bacterium]|nr:KH domain-containing protein [Gracilibacteraceae bacterium]
MKEVVEVLAKALVEKPEQVVVEETETGRTVHIKLTVAQEDVGKVIGKQGRIANAMRAVLKAAALKSGRKVIMDIE